MKTGAIARTRYLLKKKKDWMEQKKKNREARLIAKTRAAIERAEEFNKNHADISR